jgi:predicted DNA-binding protein (UPF0251 family)
MRRRGRQNRARNIEFEPEIVCFKPCRKRGCFLERVILGYDEIEALRLADFKGLYQEDAAQMMKISRSTFSRIVTQARRKVADAILNGKIIMIKEINDDSGSSNK